jgi:chromosome partitioning protein
MRTIAVVNMKGGVGKTTTAVHLAAGLATRGLRTLLIDTDPQGNVGHVFGIRPQRTLADLLLEQASLGAAIVPGARENLDLILSTPAAFALETGLAGLPQRETLLRRRLSGLASYDAVVLDGSPAMNLLTYNALLYAEEAIVPIGMDRMAIIGARQTLRGVREIRDLWPEHPLEILAVLPIAVNPATVATRLALEVLEADAEMGRHVFRPGIRQCIDLTYATAHQQTIWEYAPKSNGAADYTALVEHVLRRRAQQETTLDAQVKEA